MKHKINVTVGGRIVGTAMVSEDGVMEADIDQSLVPIQFRDKIAPGMFSLAPEEGKELG